MMTTQNMKRNEGEGEDKPTPKSLAPPVVVDADAAKAQREDRTVGGDHSNTAAFVAEHKPTP